MMLFIMRRANTQRCTGPKRHETTAPSAATDPPEPAEVHAIPAYVVLATLVRHLLLPAIKWGTQESDGKYIVERRRGNARSSDASYG